MCHVIISMYHYGVVMFFDQSSLYTFNGGGGGGGGGGGAFNQVSLKLLLKTWQL